MRPEIRTLADFHLTLKNPVWAGLADKFDQLENPQPVDPRSAIISSRLRKLSE
jgi:hypothetical protein